MRYTGKGRLVLRGVLLCKYSIDFSIVHRSASGAKVVPVPNAVITILSNTNALKHCSTAAKKVSNDVFSF